MFVNTKNAFREWHQTTQARGLERLKMDEKKGMVLLFSILSVMALCSVLYGFFIIHSGNVARVERLEKSLAEARAEVQMGTACILGIKPR